MVSAYATPPPPPGGGVVRVCESVGRVGRIEIDGAEPSADVLWATTSSYGHFTAMQVRGGRVRGLAHHMRRLEAATREAFGVGLDPERVRGFIRHALADAGDASVRVYVYGGSGEAAIMVTVKPPGEMATPQRLQSVRYQRPDAHIKHVATDQGHYRGLAERNGFDDALLMDDDEIVSETTMANFGVFDGADVVWPDAPMLIGVTMQLLNERLPSVGISTRRATVRLADIPAFGGAFLSNARGLASVTQVNDAGLPVPAERMRTLADAYASIPWDSL